MQNIKSVKLHIFPGFKIGTYFHFHNKWRHIKGDELQLHAATSLGYTKIVSGEEYRQTKTKKSASQNAV